MRKLESRDVRWLALTHTVESGPEPGQELSSLPPNPGLWQRSTFYEGKGIGVNENGLHYVSWPRVLVFASSHR